MIDVEEAAVLYRRGETTVTLGKRYDVTPSAINAALRRNGVAIRQPHRGSLPKGGKTMTDAIVAAYVRGDPPERIAGRLGLSPQTIRRRLQANGVTLRPGRLQPPTVSVPTDSAQLGYFAGLLDGEGHIHIRQRNGRNPGGKLAIYSTTTGVMTWLQDNIGGRVRWVDRSSQGWKLIGVWEIYRAYDVALLLQAALPLLIVKREKAHEVLAVLGSSVH